MQSAVIIWSLTCCSICLNMSSSELPVALITPNKLVSNLFSQKQIGKYCDIKLKLGNVIQSAHACVVGSFSAFFDKLVTSREVTPSVFGNNTPVVNVPLSVDGFYCELCASKVIDFMYFGKIQIDDPHIEHIQVISHGLEVVELLKICEKHLEKRRNIHQKIKDISDKGESFLKETESGNLIISASKERVVTKPNDGISVQPSITNESSKFTNDDALEEKEWSGMTCPVCHVIFMSIVKFQQHSSSHLGKIYTTCFVCNYASLRVSDLIKHLQEKDHGEKVCSLCLYEASSNQSLKEHLQHHDHSQPFFCLTCNTRFQTRTALNSHIVKHSSETPHRCNECGRGFKWKHGLQSHMVTHTSVKKLLCDQCGFSTAHLKSFIDHKSVHSGETYKCPVLDCKFKSVRKESVKQHLSTHSKEKPYQCEICGQAFSQAKNLRRHAAIHDPAIDPELCPFCPFQTTRSDKFRDHFRRFHKDGNKDKPVVKPKKQLSNKAVNKDSGKRFGSAKKTSALQDSKEEKDENFEISSKVLTLEASKCVCDGDSNEVDSTALVCFDNEGRLPGMSSIPYMTLNACSSHFNVRNNAKGVIIHSDKDVKVSSNFSVLVDHASQKVASHLEELHEDTHVDNILKPGVGCNEILIFDESISQPTPCRILLCNDGNVVVIGEEYSVATISEEVSISDETEQYVPESMKEDAVMNLSEPYENKILSLTCHENPQDVENCNVDKNIDKTVLQRTAEEIGLEFNACLEIDQLSLLSSAAEERVLGLDADEN